MVSAMEALVAANSSMDRLPTVTPTPPTSYNCSSPLPYLNITCEMPINYAVPLYGRLMPVLLVITIVANSLIVIVLSRRHMRSPTNAVLMAMALCDMLTLLFPAPWLIYMYTLGNHYRPLAPAKLCYTYNVMNEVLPNMFHTASIWLTLALAVQRYIYVCHPPLARKFCTMPIVSRCLAYIMLAAALHQSSRLFDQDFEEVEIFWDGKRAHACSRTTAYWVIHYVTEDVYFMYYYLFRIVFVHLTPCCALVVLNVLLFRALRQAQKRREQLLSSGKKPGAGGQRGSGECRKLRDSNCTTLMLIVVVTVFLVVEIPLAVVTTLHVLSSTIVDEFLDYYVANALVLITNFLIILSYPINFAIYCGMSRQFRETFKELFASGCGGRCAGAASRNSGSRTGGARSTALGSSRYSLVNGPRTCTNETIL